MMKHEVGKKINYKNYKKRPQSIQLTSKTHDPGYKTIITS